MNITGGSTVPDNVSLNLNTSNQLQIKTAGVTPAKLSFSPGFSYISTTTLSGDGTDVSVTVPTGYHQLYLIFRLNGKTNNGYINLRFNADTTNGHYYVNYLTQVGGTLAGAAASTDRLTDDINTQGFCVIRMNITNIATEQKLVTATRSGYSGQSIWGGYWTNTSDEISTILLYRSAANFTAGDSVTLYGSTL